MTGLAKFDLLSLATPYALHAVPFDECTVIERRIATAPAAKVGAFRAEVRVVREAMAEVAATTSIDPPVKLRGRVLKSIAAPSRSRWRTAGFAGAAAAAAAIGFGAGFVLRSAPPSPADRVFTASDVRTASDAIPAGGTATVVYSRDRDAAVLILDNVNPPAAGTVYQMWLIENQKRRSAGTMGRQAVSSSTVIGDLGRATTLAFTAEPGNGSAQPTGQIFVALPLS